MTTISNTTEVPSVPLVTSHWEIIDNFNYVLDTVTVEAPAGTSERDIEYLAMSEFADDQRSVYEDENYKAEVVISSISHARRV